MFAIDFEASCLPRDGRSFPIEVGIASICGGTRNWLIRPAAEWTGWTWTDEAERLHGLSGEDLMREGRPAAEVMVALNAALAGQRVIADHSLDRLWLAILSEAAGIPPEFHVEHLSTLLDACEPSAQLIETAMADANRRVPVRHRAGPDAQWLATVASAIVDQARVRGPRLFDMAA